MKIAMLGHKYIPSREGGIEVVVEELCVRMAALGHNIVCYNRKNPNFSIKKTSNYKGIKIKEVFTINKRGLAAVTSSVFGSIGAAFGKYDVVHIHAEGPAFMCWLPKLFGKKVIVTIHGLDHQRAKWGKFASWYIRSGEKNAVRFADEIIVLSKGIQDYFKETYHRNTKFIPNGVNRKERRTADMIADKWNLKENDYILYLGRIVPEKGIHYLIQAFQNLQTDKKLVIAGGSSDTDKYMAELRKMAKNDSQIIFTGFVEGRLKHELYSNAYIYTLPSDLEGMPLSLLEAMSYGCCCLTSDIAECAEVVENKAVTFRKGNVADLKTKLQMLCNSPKTAEKYRDEAADFICEKYKWDDVVEKTLRLYV